MDLRGYPHHVAIDALAHFASTPVAGPKLEVPLVREVGAHKLVEVSAVSIREPLAPQINAKLFALVDAETASRPLGDHQNRPVMIT